MDEYKVIDNKNLTEVDNGLEDYQHVELNFQEIRNSTKITNSQLMFLLQPHNVYYMQHNGELVYIIWNLLNDEQKVTFYRCCINLISNSTCYFYLTTNIMANNIDKVNYNIIKSLKRYTHKIYKDNSIKKIIQQIIEKIIIKEPEVIPVNEYINIIQTTIPKEFAFKIQNLIEKAFKLKNLKKSVTLLHLRYVLVSDVFTNDNIIINYLLDNLLTNSVTFNVDNEIIEFFHYLVSNLPRNVIEVLLLNKHEYVEDLLLLFIHSEPSLKIKKFIIQIVFLYIKYASKKKITYEEIVLFYKKTIPALDNDEYIEIIETLAVLKDQKLILELFPSFESFSEFIESIDYNDNDNTNITNKINEIKNIMNFYE